jgi:hypothetical protein
MYHVCVCVCVCVCVFIYICVCVWVLPIHQHIISDATLLPTRADFSKGTSLHGTRTSGQ